MCLSLSLHIGLLYSEKNEWNRFGSDFLRSSHIWDSGNMKKMESRRQTGGGGGHDMGEEGDPLSHLVVMFLSRPMLSLFMARV